MQWFEDSDSVFDPSTTWCWPYSRVWKARLVGWGVWPRTGAGIAETVHIVS